MPYHINTVGPGKFEVVDDQGKVAGTHPTRKQALAQLKALYANVPEARKEASDMEDTEKATAEINNLPDSAFLYVESGGDKDEAGKTVPRSLRHLPYKTQDGGIDLPKLRNALSRLGQSATGNVGGESWLTEGVRKSLISKAQKILADNTDAASAQPEKKEAQPSILDRVIAALKGDFEGHPFRGNQYNGGSGGSSGEESGANEDSGEDNEPIKGLSKSPKQLTHVSLDEFETEVDKVKNDKPTLNRIEHAINRRKIIENDRAQDPKASDEVVINSANKVHALNQKRAVIKRYLATKEGKRNSSPDGDRLQQIHDLAVLNGASCPMVMKEVSGKLRWVLLTSNAFQDSDKEIISQKALEADVARTDKEAPPYGPLRWWHMGNPDPIAMTPGPGVDLGDCDFRAMSGRVLIESGTFRNERVGHAIKEKADDLQGSGGFFHPRDQPDSEGVYETTMFF